MTPWEWIRKFVGLEEHERSWLIKCYFPMWVVSESDETGCTTSYFRVSQSYPGFVVKTKAGHIFFVMN